MMVIIDMPASIHQLQDEQGREFVTLINLLILENLSGDEHTGNSSCTVRSELNFTFYALVHQSADNSLCCAPCVLNKFSLYETEKIIQFIRIIIIVNPGLSAVERVLQFVPIYIHMTTRSRDKALSSSMHLDSRIWEAVKLIYQYC